MPFGIPAEDFHGGFGLPDLSEESNHVIECAYRPTDIHLVSRRYVGDCPRCGRLVEKNTCSYCPRCGAKLDWE